MAGSFRYTYVRLVQLQCQLEFILTSLRINRHIFSSSENISMLCYKKEIVTSTIKYQEYKTKERLYGDAIQDGVTCMSTDVLI